MKKFFLMFASAAFLFSCNSDNNLPATNNFAPQANTTSSALQELRNQAFNDMNGGGVVFYNSKEGVVFYPKVKSNTKITIPPRAIRSASGQELNGEIRIDYVEIFDKSKMVVANTPTMGIGTGSEVKRLLVTGGEFYLNITDMENQPVQVVAPIEVSINTGNSEANPNGMVLWNGERDNNDNLTWNQAETDQMSFENNEPVFVEGGQYNVLIKNSSNFGWCNIDKFFQFGGNPTTIDVIVPSGFNYTNSSVYMAVAGQNNMMAQLDVFHPSTNSFSEHTGIVPEGLDVHLIFVGEQNGNYVYYIESLPLGPNATYDFSNANLITAPSYHDLEQAIQQLP